jgi:hypothetical protein
MRHDDPDPHACYERRCQLWGWWLFVVSAVFFVAASVRAGDPLGLLGAVFFLVACFVFLAPLWRRSGQSQHDER